MRNGVIVYSCLINEHGDGQNEKMCVYHQREVVRWNKSI